MKSLAPLLLIFLLFASQAFAAETARPHPAGQPGTARATVRDRPIRDKWAVVIGIDHFKDKRIPKLSYPAKDAADFADFLVSKGNFARDHVLLLTNEKATVTTIKRVIGDDWLPRRVLEDDVVLIFASTHGSPKELDVAGQNFLIAYDTNVEALFSTAIELQDLSDTIKKRTQCDRVVVFLDACNSGAAEAGGGKGLVRSSNFNVSDIAGVGQIVVSSSDAQQRSWESMRYKNGVFTRRLIESFMTKGATTKLSEAFDSLKDLVEEEVKFDRRVEQTPVMKMNWNGSELALMAVPARPRQTEPYRLEGDDASAGSAGEGPAIASSQTGTAGKTTTSDAQSGSGHSGSAQSTGASQQTSQSSTGVANAAGSAPAQSSTSGGNTGAAPQISGSHNKRSGGKTPPLEGGTQITEIIPGSIGVVPFGGPLNVNVRSSQGDLWGAVSSPQELMNLPETLSACLDEDLSHTAKLKDKVQNHLRVGDGIRANFPALNNTHLFNCSRWREGDWKLVGQKLGVPYVLTGVIDEVLWYPTTFSNRYQVIVSGKIIDCSTGQAVAQVDKLTIAKAPWTSDMGGGKKYFEKFVVPEAAKSLLHDLLNQMKNKW